MKIILIITLIISICINIYLYNKVQKAEKIINFIEKVEKVISK